MDSKFNPNVREVEDVKQGANKKIDRMNRIYRIKQ
jgi:hypothetical protein